jgi:hypothetical protein
VRNISHGEKARFPARNEGQMRVAVLLTEALVFANLLTVGPSAHWALKPPNPYVDVGAPSSAAPTGGGKLSGRWSCSRLRMGRRSLAESRISSLMKRVGIA